MKTTKKKIVQYSSAAALFLSCAINGNAQSFELGFRYEPEFSTLMNKNDQNAGTALTYVSHFTYINFGIGGSYNFTNTMGIAVDVILSREGQDYTGNFANGTYNAATYSSVVATQAFLNNLVIPNAYACRAELNFVKLPIMFSLMSDNTKPLFFTLQLGPQINFLYNVAQEVNHTDEDYPNTNVTPIGLYKAVTIDGVLALGAAYNLSSHVVLSARLCFDYGFEDVENKDATISYNGGPSQAFYSSNRDATHNATAGLLIGLDFKI